jgi:hypothetical protein
MGSVFLLSGSVSCTAFFTTGPETVCQVFVLLHFLYRAGFSLYVTRPPRYTAAENGVEVPCSLRHVSVGMCQYLYAELSRFDQQCCHSTGPMAGTQCL